MTAITDTHPLRDSETSLVSTLHLTYALHAIGLVAGALAASTFVGSLLFGWPSLIAVVIDYVKRNNATGTWMRTHFQWQIRTFWYGMVAAAAIGALGAMMSIVLVGVPVWSIGFFALGLWTGYRIVTGWMRLSARQGI
ncbi:MAG TPA: hypothetical protein VF491_16840 [Vicinamibacterales bacterium]